MLVLLVYQVMFCFAQKWWEFGSTELSAKYENSI